MREKIFMIASEQGIQTTVDEVEQVLSTIDVGLVTAKHLERISIVLWDGESPVGNASAAQIKQQEGLPENAKGYWIYVDGQPAYFQPVSPFAGEKAMTDPQPVAERHKQVMAEEFASQEIIQMVIAQLRANADQRLQAMEDALLALMLQGGAN